MRDNVTIVCIGQAVADIVVRSVDRLPLAGTAEPVEQLQLLSGGCAANTAAVLAKLGAEVRLAALIGRDTLGDALLADLQTAGVRLDAVVRQADAPTSAAIVLVAATGQRSFFYRTGGNERLANRHVDDAVLKSARIVHVGGAMKLLNLDLAELMGRAKSFGCITSLDTDWDINGRWMKKLDGALPAIDYLMTNDEEAAMLTGKSNPREAAADLLLRGPKAVAVKRGERGRCWPRRMESRKSRPAAWKCSILPAPATPSRPDSCWESAAACPWSSRCDWATPPAGCAPRRSATAGLPRLRMSIT